MANSNNNGFLTGVIIGGLLGGMAGLLTAPKSGRELRDDLADTYCNLKEKTQDIADQLKKTGSVVLHPFAEEENNHEAGSFLKGGALGALFGASAAFILAPKSGAKMRKTIASKYENLRERAEDLVTELNHKRHDAMDNIEDWKDTLVSAIEKATSKKRGNHSTMGNVAHWAGLGFRLYQELQKKRK